MPLSNLSDEEIRELEDKLLEKVPEDGTTIGNKTLRGKLKWGKDEYYAIRNRLIEKGKLKAGRGRGGSVRRIDVSSGPEVDKETGQVPETTGVTPTGEPQAPSDKASEEYQNEQGLYAPMRKALEVFWVEPQAFDQVIIEKTDQGGKKKTGKWSRPDITILAQKAYQYIPNKVFDVITFEIKYKGYLDVTAIYEALSHKKAATMSFVIAWVPEDDKEKDPDKIANVEREAQRHGIGLILAEDPEDPETWEILVDAIREEPDPALLDEFLRVQIPQDSLKQWAKWLK